MTEPRSCNPKPSRASPGRPRSPEVDEAILDHALALFAESGLSGVTFEQLAKRSGVSRTAIYRRWSSREELVAFALGRLREASERGFADWAERPLQEVLAWFLDNAPRQMLNPLYLSLMRHTLALGPEASELKKVYWQTILLPRRRAFSEQISLARAEGSLGPGPDPELLQDMLTGALVHRLLIDPRSKSEPALRAFLGDLFEALGLRPPAKRARRRDK